MRALYPSSYAREALVYVADEEQRILPSRPWREAVPVRELRRSWQEKSDVITGSAQNVDAVSSVQTGRKTLHVGSFGLEHDENRDPKKFCQG